MKSRDYSMLSVATGEIVVFSWLERKYSMTLLQKKGDLTLHDVKVEQLASGLTADLWAGVHERLATGDMPPKGEQRPPSEELNRVILWVRAELLNAGRGIDLTGEQQTKTRKALEFFAEGLKAGAA